MAIAAVLSTAPSGSWVRVPLFAYLNFFCDISFYIFVGWSIQKILTTCQPLNNALENSVRVKNYLYLDLRRTRILMMVEGECVRCASLIEITLILSKENVNFVKKITIVHLEPLDFVVEHVQPIERPIILLLTIKEHIKSVHVITVYMVVKNNRLKIFIKELMVQDH